MLLNRFMIQSKCAVRTFQPLKINLKFERKICRSSVLQKDEENKDDSKKSKDSTSNESEIPSFLSGRFEIFREENAPIIFDIEEERRLATKYFKTDMTAINTLEQEPAEKFAGVDLTRGVQGVFDVVQLSDLLLSDGAIDMFVAELPSEIRYAEHIMIVTGRSSRHRKALAQLVRRVYKAKCLPSDGIPRIEGIHEGGSNTDWVALDLGNIILHIFARAAREKYDLESLWTLGSEHDLQSARPDDPLIELLAQHSVYLGDLEPAEPSVHDSDLSDSDTNDSSGR